MLREIAKSLRGLAMSPWMAVSHAARRQARLFEAGGKVSEQRRAHLPYMSPGAMTDNDPVERALHLAHFMARESDAAHETKGYTLAAQDIDLDRFVAALAAAPFRLKLPAPRNGRIQVAPELLQRIGGGDEAKGRRMLQELVERYRRRPAWC